MSSWYAFQFQTRGRQLGSDVFDVRRVHAAGTGLDAVRQQVRADEVVEDLAVGLVLGVGRLS
jgi:hypothetical protein